jgi:uncharacterized Fe-S cluster-containing protein
MTDLRESDEEIEAWENKRMQREEDRAKRLTATQLDLKVTAEDCIWDQTELGAEKYDPDEWRKETARRHIRRAIKHSLTALEILDGDRLNDGEDHLAAAVCRMTMGFWVADNTKTG